jgi:SAM-dependent methyltransferase
VNTSSCCLCGNENFSILLSGYDHSIRSNQRIYQFIQCTRCGLVALTPRPNTPEEMAEIYPATYDSYMGKRQSLLIFMRRIAWQAEINEILSLTSRSAQILEIGSATGEFLNELRRQGRECLTGIEISSNAAHIARKRHNLEIYIGELNAINLPTASVDLVVMRHTLEHVSNPMTTMKKIKQLLTPGGICIFTIPNIDSHTARIFQEDWYGYDVPRHSYLFPIKTINLLLKVVGLNKLSTIHISTPNVWIGSTRFWLEARGHSKLASFFRYQNPFALALFGPLGLTSALMQSSGFIRIIAQRPI